MEYADFLRARREEILARMGAAISKSGRTWADVSLVAVSKTVDVDALLCALRVGYRHFGENRPQELVRKLDALALEGDLPPYRFDMIGNLQTNKINAVLGRAELIHSIGSLHLAQAVSSRAERRMGAGELMRPQPVLLEVNVSGEATKSGFSPSELVEALPDIVSLCGISLQGLMTMAPRGDKEGARRCFAHLRELRDYLVSQLPGLSLPELSCGMSEDFDVALEEGSTIVRLGRVVFDPQFEVK